MLYTSSKTHTNCKHSQKFTNTNRGTEEHREEKRERQAFSNSESARLQRNRTGGVARGHSKSAERYPLCSRQNWQQQSTSRHASPHAIDVNPFAVLVRHPLRKRRYCGGRTTLFVTINAIPTTTRTFPLKSSAYIKNCLRHRPQKPLRGWFSLGFVPFVLGVFPITLLSV